MTGEKLPDPAIRGFEVQARDETERRERRRREIAAMPWNERLGCLDGEERAQAAAIVEAFVRQLSDFASGISLYEFLPGNPEEFARHLLRRLEEGGAALDWWHYARHALRIGCAQLSVKLAEVAASWTSLHGSDHLSDLVLECASVVDNRRGSEFLVPRTHTRYEVRIHTTSAAGIPRVSAVFGVDGSGWRRPVELDPQTAASLAEATFD